MKIRSGFVSNSSSSSFIVGVAEVVDEAAVNAYIAEHKLQDAELDIQTVGEIKLNRCYDARFSNGEIIISSFCTEVSLNVTDKPDSTKIVFTSICNNEGDGFFLDGEGDLNYDIDLDFFNAEQQAIYDVFNNPGCHASQVEIGAARNG